MKPFNLDEYLKKSFEEGGNEGWLKRKNYLYR